MTMLLQQLPVEWLQQDLEQCVQVLRQRVADCHTSLLSCCLVVTLGGR